jgi:hypothetical protein
MSRTSNTKRYYEIARDCLRSAQHADNPATRDKLLDQAQVWMDAAMRETFIATIGAGDPHEPSQPDLWNEARAVRSGHEPVAVVLDFVNPVGAGRRRLVGGRSRQGLMKAPARNMPANLGHRGKESSQNAPP